MENKLAINLKILDRVYPLRIDSADEEKLREAAKRINTIVLKYKQKYRDKDDVDFLAMASLQFMTRLIEFENDENSDSLADAVDEVCEDLDLYLKANNYSSLK